MDSKKKKVGVGQERSRDDTVDPKLSILGILESRPTTTWGTFVLEEARFKAQFKGRSPSTSTEMGGE
jgi:hypothetical protein